VYSFFIDGVRIPVAPQKIDTKIKNMNKTYKILEGGELNILKAPGLTELSFDIDLPGVLYPFAVYDQGFRPPDFYLDKLETLKTGREPFQLVISRIRGRQLLYETNIRVSLEDYKITDDAKNGTDVVVSLKLKQYVDRKTKRVTIKQATSNSAATVQAQSTASERPQKTPAKTYTVKSGDTLWRICARELGDGSRYPEIAKLNGIPNPNLINVGQVIKLE
jgi:LysM repeat protein